MTTDALTRLGVTVCAAEGFILADPNGSQIERFVARENGRTGFTAGAYLVQMAGVRGTATASLYAAFAAWIRAATRKLEKANG